MKDLGIYLDFSLLLNDHCIYVRNRKSSLLGFKNGRCKCNNSSGHIFFYLSRKFQLGIYTNLATYT